MFKFVTASEMKELESYACETSHITLDEMMQNAGRAVFDVVMDVIKPSRVLIAIGKGNNGGDALVTARLLYEKGIKVTVLSLYPEYEFTDLAILELDKVKNLNIPIKNHKSLFEPEPQSRRQIKNLKFDLIIDGLFGFSLKGDPKPPADKIIEQINCSTIPILSIDVPSGLDAGTGQIMDPAVRADYTVTLGMPKIGLDRHKEYVGKIYLGDLGIPEKAYKTLGYSSPDFRGRSYLPLD